MAAGRDKVFFDTSVLVAAVIESHPAHSRAFPWLRRAKNAEFDWAVASHSLAEMYAVLTGLPIKPRISPAVAWRLIHENVAAHAEIVSLSSTDYTSLIKRVSDGGITGGAIYDALLSRAAEKSGASRLLTLDADDFRRVWPKGADLISTP